jgi:hypothetical protein
VTVVTDGATWTGVTSKIRRLTVDRGRKHELDRVEPGTAQVEFDNRDGWLDPSVNAAVRPMLPIRLFTGRGWRTPSGSPTPGGGVFSGWIERFTYNREPLRPDEASVTVDCVDSLGLLARPFPDVSIGKRKLHRVKADDGNGWVMSYKPQTVGRRSHDLPNLPILKAHDVERAGFEWLPVYGAEMCKRYAKFIVGNYKEPRPRVRRLVVSRRMDGDEAGDLPLTVGGSWPVWDFIRFVELGNVVRIYSLSETGSKING